MNEISLNALSSKQLWNSGGINSVFSCDTETPITEVALKAISWLAQHFIEFKEEDRDPFFKLCEILEKINPSIKQLELPTNFFDSTLCKIISPPPARNLSQTLAKADAIDHSFDRVIKYLPQKETIVFNCFFRRMAIEQLVDLLEKGFWDEIALCYRIKSWDFLAYDALGAFQQKKITMEQFSTLIFRWSIGCDFFGKVIKATNIFNSDGSINKEVEGFINTTIKFPDKISSPIDRISPENVKNFFSRMKGVPRSEQYFFSFETKFKIDRGDITEIIQKIGLNVFNIYLKDPSNAVKMIASLSMMQQMLIAFKGDKAVKITPIIGLSLPEDIENNGLSDTRDMGLPFPNLPLPKMADGLSAPTSWDFWNHDFYHAFIASHMPSETRKEFIRVAKIIRNFSDSIPNDPNITVFFNNFYEYLIDMEGSEYRSKNQVDGNYLFAKMIIKRFLVAFKKMGRSNECLLESIIPQLRIHLEKFIDEKPELFSISGITREVSEIIQKELFKERQALSKRLQSTDPNVHIYLRGEFLTTLLDVEVMMEKLRLLHDSIFSAHFREMSRE